MNHVIGRIQNIFRGTVILFQLNYFRLRIFFLNILNIIYIGASEFINRLIIVADHAQVSVFGRQQTDKLKLYGIGILILIDHNILKPFLIVFKYIRIQAEQFHRLIEQIVKIKGVIFFQYF